MNSSSIVFNYFKILSARESSAVLIGAHSYGQFHAGNSMFKYSWTRDQTKYLNNQVIKIPDTQKHADDAVIDAYFGRWC